jgi:hypothetical protein
MGFVGAMVGEMPHEGFLTLLDFGQHVPPVLFHCLTGESVHLPDRCSLYFDITGYGYLEPMRVGGQTKWATEFLFNSVSTSTDGDMVAWHKPTDKYTLLETIRGAIRIGACAHKCSSGEFACELYIHEAPPEHADCLRFWTLPYIQHFTVGDNVDSRWVCKNVLRWIGNLRCVITRTIGQTFNNAASTQYIAHSFSKPTQTLQLTAFLVS